MTIKKRLAREWMFRGLLFESEAERFREAGIRIGADQMDAERSLLEEALVPFGVQTRNDALRMARLYALLFCFENSVRTLITERLQENHGAEWWEKTVPKKVRDFADSRKKEADKNSWLEGQSHDLLTFIQFGHLADIVISNWDDFTDLFPSQHWIKQRLDELEQARNFIAHARTLLSGEYSRIEMYIADWNRNVGL